MIIEYKNEYEKFFDDLCRILESQNNMTRGRLSVSYSSDMFTSSTYIRITLQQDYENS